MSIRTTSPRLGASRSAVKAGLRWPRPDTLAWLLLVFIAMVCASVAGLLMSGA
jgi:hypothetical protein